MIFCRDNFSDSMMLDHVNNPAVSQLCSFITIHMPFFPCCCVEYWKHFRLRYYWIISIYWPVLGDELKAQMRIL